MVAGFGRRLASDQTAIDPAELTAEVRFRRRAAVRFTPLA